MKRIFTLFVAFAAILMSSRIQAVEFGYDAGAELVSAYIWRGQYNGGLSFQPDVAVGFDAEHSSLRVGAWGSLGASDWKFVRGLAIDAEGNDPNTRFIPEVDIYLNANIWGVTVGFTHYYYFGGSPFLNWKNPENGTSQTEVSLGYDFSTLFEKVPLSITWNTMVLGSDHIEQEDGSLKRAFSTYIEAKYDLALPFDMTLSLAVGISPWASTLYGNDGFAVNNIAARLQKAWDFDVCELDLFALGSINTYGINKSNAFIWQAGDYKLYQQRLNGCIGLGVWF